MAIRWRCPICTETNSEVDVNAAGLPLACDRCERAVLPAETLCTVCDAPNPWWRRDSLHYVCRDCGTSQTFYAPVLVASAEPESDADESAA